MHEDNPQSQQDTLHYSTLQKSLHPNSNKNKVFSSFSRQKKQKKSNLFQSLTNQHDNDHNDYFTQDSIISAQFVQQFDHESKQKKQRTLFKLQELLQKQYLMLQKQQFEKVKFLKEIQAEMKNYYSLLIELKDNNNPSHQSSRQQSVDTSKLSINAQKSSIKGNRIVTDDGFDNCYNFIKQVIINTSKNYEVAIVLLLNCSINYQNPKVVDEIYITDYQQLVYLFINVFYERVSETDPFLKDITKLISALLAKLPKERLEGNDKIVKQTFKFNKIKGGNRKSSIIDENEPISTNNEKIIYIFNEYMKKQEIQDYFAILSNNILKKIQKVSFSRAQNRRGVQFDRSKSIIDETDQSFQLNSSIGNSIQSFDANKLPEDWLQHSKPFESFFEQKKILMMEFLSEIYHEADLCPLSLKIPLKYYYQSQKAHLETKQNNSTSQISIKQLCCLKIWHLIQKYYFQGFSLSRQNKKTSLSTQNHLLKHMSSLDKEILKDIVDGIKSYLGNSYETVGTQENQLNRFKKCIKYIVKVVEKLINIPEDKFQQYRTSIIQNSIGLKQPKVLIKTKTQVQNQQKDDTLSLSTPNSLSKKTSTKNSNQDGRLQFVLPPQLIKIYGGCISFRQIHILLTSLKRVKDNIFNQRIVNRVNRIFDMSPDLEFLFPKKVQNAQQQSKKMFVVLTELQYDPLIEDDYHKLYLKEYESNKVKNIIRQIICDTRLDQFNKNINKNPVINKRMINILQYQLEDIKMVKKQKKVMNVFSPPKQIESPKILVPLLQHISNQCSQSLDVPIQYQNLSIQLIKKIKYLLYLFQQKSLQLNESKILQEMLAEVQNRNDKMTKLYEHTKFGLLAAIGNIKHYRNLLTSKKDIENKVVTRIKYIQAIESLTLALCLTSPFTRNNPEFSEYQSPRQHSDKSLSQQKQQLLRSSFKKSKSMSQSSVQSRKSLSIQQKQKQIQEYRETFNRYKYRMSNADEIILCDTKQCIHKENIFWGLNYHLNNVKEFIYMFCKIRQVAQSLFFTSYIISEQLSTNIYKKIHQGLKHFNHVYHPFSTVFLNSKYQKLNYSVDKINKTVYNFIEMIFEKTKETLKISSKSQGNELKKVIKDVLFREVHGKFIIKKIKGVKNYETDQNQKKKTKKTRLTSQKDSIHFDSSLTQNRLLNAFETLQMSDNFDHQDVSDFDPKSNENNLLAQNLVKLNGFNEKTGFKISNYLNEDIKDNKLPNHLKVHKEEDLIYKSRNDIIFSYQIKKLNNYQNVLLLNAKNHSKGSIQASNHEISQQQIHLKQIEEVCSRFIKHLNHKQSPEEKIQYLKNIRQIYKLIVESSKKIINGKKAQNKNLYQQYTLSHLIFKSILAAEPPNFITNLGFIELYLPQQKLLSKQGDILEQFKKIAREIFNSQQQTIGKYFIKIKRENQQEIRIEDIEQYTNLQNIKKKGQSDSYL